MANRKYIERKMKLNGNATLLDWLAMQKDKVIANKRIDIINSFDNHNFSYNHVKELISENYPNNKSIEKIFEGITETKDNLDYLYKRYESEKPRFWNNESREVTYNFMKLQLDIMETHAKYERQINLALSYN